MMKYRTTILMALAGACFMLLACATTQHGHHRKGAGKSDVLYTCNCGPQCECGTVGTKPGTCACGKELVPGHIVKVEGTEALVCRCGDKCTCAIDPKDPSKCGCGKTVKRVDLKGTGIYFCNCGGSCFCNHASENPGTCGCGMNLKKAD